MAKGDTFQQGFQAECAVPFQRFRRCLDAFRHADRIHNNEAVLAFRRWGGSLQITRQDGSCAAAAHLFEILCAPHITQEDHDFKRLYVCAGGHHVHGCGNPEKMVRAKILD
jgi:hypothetical protein